MPAHLYMCILITDVLTLTYICIIAPRSRRIYHVTEKIDERLLILSFNPFFLSILLLRIIFLKIHETFSHR